MLAVAAFLAVACGGWFLFRQGGAGDVIILGGGPGTPEQQEALADARRLLAEGETAHEAWRAAVKASDGDEAARQLREAMSKLQDAMKLTQSTMDNSDWRGWGWPKGAWDLAQKIAPYIHELELAEWAEIEATRSAGQGVATLTSGSRLGPIDLATASLVPDRDIRLGASIAAVRSALDVPSSITAKELNQALRDRGVMGRFRDNRLVGIDFLFHTESITFYYGSDYSGRVWGKIGASTTRSDLIALLGWPTEAPVQEPYVDYPPPEGSPPYVLIYDRGDCRVSFDFQRGLYGNVSSISVELKGLPYDESERASRLHHTVGSSGRFVFHDF